MHEFEQKKTPIQLTRLLQDACHKMILGKLKYNQHVDIFYYILNLVLVFWQTYNTQSWPK